MASSSVEIAGGNTGSLYGGRDGNDLGSKIGIIGVNHFKQLTKNAYLSSTIGLNYSSTDQVNCASDRTTSEYYAREENNVAKTGYNFSTSYNAKINSRLFVKIGIQDEVIGLNVM